MTRLADLSYDEQIKLCRKIAPGILARYGLRNAQLTLPTGGLGIVFRVEAEMPECFGVNRFVLRIHRDGSWYVRHSDAAIESGLRWLIALRRDTDLIVPEPVFARDGSLVQRTVVDGLEKEIRCTLLGWIEGEFIDEELTPDHLRKAGVFAARLHEHALKFAISEKVHRPRMDWRLALSPWMNCDIREKDLRSTTLLSENELRIFVAAADRVLKEIRQIPKNQNYGLIHGDFSHRNFLFHEGAVRAIDFDGCCWNHHMCELAGTLYFLYFQGERENFEALHDSLLEGYASIRPLPEGYEKQLTTFQMAIHLYIYEGLSYSTDYDRETITTAIRLLRFIEDIY
ncbi:phosphotransferase enzyme family protein [Candidatus Poribacteria bacterium]